MTHSRMTKNDFLLALRKAPRVFVSPRIDAYDMGIAIETDANAVLRACMKSPDWFNEDNYYAAYVNKDGWLYIGHDDMVQSSGGWKPMPVPVVKYEKGKRPYIKQEIPELSLTHAPNSYR
jgi:hypothetical protein